MLQLQDHQLVVIQIGVYPLERSGTHNDIEQSKRKVYFFMSHLVVHVCISVRQQDVPQCSKIFAYIAFLTIMCVRIKRICITGFGNVMNDLVNIA